MHPTFAFPEKTLGTPDGERLRVCAADVRGGERATVVLTHGLGEHAGRYEPVARAFAKEGLRLVAWDLRGHGRSSGRRGDAADYERLLDDLGAVWVHAEREAAGRPMFLMGHSLGGQITLAFAQRRQPAACRGVVALSPWLRLAFAPARWKLALAGVARRVWPGMLQRTPKNPALLSRDLAYVATLAAPELIHNRISARLFFDIVCAGEGVLTRAGEMRAPLLLVHGDADRVTCASATRELHARAGSTDKTLAIYPDALHETHNDLCRERVLADVAAWITARLPRDADRVPGL